MVKFELEPYHRNTSDEELIADLKRVASQLKKDSVTTYEYNEYGKFHSSTLCRKWGGWFKALEKAGLQRTRNLDLTDEKLFKNLEEVWIKLGRQPKYDEMQKPFSMYCAGTYEYRFDTWRKALEQFIKYINKEEIPQVDKEPIVENKAISTKNESVIKHKTKRQISDRLRFIIMKRNNFKCQNCGWSPATGTGRTLEVDHIIPWSKGGETVSDNLQTLCSKCNGGKSNL